MLPALDAIFIIIIGLLIWFVNLGLLPVNWHKDWPLILILFGVSRLIKISLKKRRL